MSLQKKMFEELEQRSIFDNAKDLGLAYSDQVHQMEVFPNQDKLNRLTQFEEPFPEKIGDVQDIVNLLNDFGSEATIAQTGGRYFGFVNGGALPVSIAVQLMTDFWDQCGGLYLTSPVNSKLEEVCEAWLKDVFNLPDSTVAGFVTGTSMANLSAICAARYRLLKNQGWDIFEKGMRGAPRIKIYAHEQVHSSVFKSLNILGFGKEDLISVKADEHGRMDISDLPELDNSSLVLTQAGNVNTGNFDPFDAICEKANQAGAWVHVDGAFGLWAAACQSTKHFMKGFEKADSWAVDGHKTLNTPYDNGIVLCKDKEALVASLEANADYLIKVEQRDPILYGPEMSKRARAFEVWSVLKYLGREGVDEMIQNFCDRAKQFGEGLKAMEFEVLNEVVFNQVLFKGKTEEETTQILTHIQNSGKMWCGSSKWNGELVIRISVCSWATTVEDVELALEVIGQGR